MKIKGLRHIPNYHERCLCTWHLKVCLCVEYCVMIPCYGCWKHLKRLARESRRYEGSSEVREALSKQTSYMWLHWKRSYFPLDEDGWNESAICSVNERGFSDYVCIIDKRIDISLMQWFQVYVKGKCPTIDYLQRLRFNVYLYSSTWKLCDVVVKGEKLRPSWKLLINWRHYFTPWQQLEDFFYVYLFVCLFLTFIVVFLVLIFLRVFFCFVKKWCITKAGQ